MTDRQQRPVNTRANRRAADRVVCGSIIQPNHNTLMDLQGQHAQRGYAMAGLLVSLAVIVIRILWVFPAAYLPRLIFKKLCRRDPYPKWQHVTIVAWTGMRGVVSLAARPQGLTEPR